MSTCNQHWEKVLKQFVLVLIVLALFGALMSACGGDNHKATYTLADFTHEDGWVTGAIYWMYGNNEYSEQSIDSSTYIMSDGRVHARLTAQVISGDMPSFVAGTHNFLEMIHNGESNGGYDSLDTFKKSLLLALDGFTSAKSFTHGGGLKLVVYVD